MAAKITIFTNKLNALVIWKNASVYLAKQYKTKVYMWYHHNDIQQIWEVWVFCFGSSGFVTNTVLKGTRRNDP